MNERLDSIGGAYMAGPIGVIELNNVTELTIVTTVSTNSVQTTL